jgi:hypothetical protein
MDSTVPCFVADHNFFIGLQYECYFLNKPVLELTVQLIDKNTKQKPGDNALIGPVNNAMHSMIKSVVVSIQGEKINPSDGHYGYRAYFTGMIYLLLSLACISVSRCHRPIGDPGGGQPPPLC